jgi:hypothetical protein
VCSSGSARASGVSIVLINFLLEAQALRVYNLRPYGPCLLEPS